MIKLINSIGDYKPEMALANVLEAFKVDIARSPNDIDHLSTVMIRCSCKNGKERVYRYSTRIVEEIDHSRSDTPNNLYSDELYNIGGK